jgi:hypothetical protein
LIQIKSSVLSGGSGWTTGTPSTNIYNTALGNVGIGTTNPQQKLDIQGTNPTIRLLDTNTDGNAIIQFRETSDLYGMDIAYIGNLDNKMYIRAYNASATAVNHITIDRASGYVGIATTNPTTAKLVIGGANGATGFDMSSADQYADMRVIRNSLSSIDKNMFIGYGGGAGSKIYFYSNNADTMRCDGGNVYVNFACIGGGYFLAPSIYARGSYDVSMTQDGGGMYLRYGSANTTNSDFLEISASSGATNINSNSSRPIYLRQYGYTTSFIAGFTQNGANSLYWNTISDHRVKENIKKSNLQTCYDNVKNINLYRYNYINGFNDKIKDKTQLGFIAQQVHQHFPKSVSREKIRIEDKREIPDLANIDVAQVNFTLFGAVKQLMKVVEKQSKRIKKLEEMLGIIDDDVVDNDADEPYVRIVCDEVDIDDIEPSEPVGV